jgi:hypothetical protein
MRLKDPAGRYFMVDDPLWTPIFEWLGRDRLRQLGEADEILARAGI